MLLTVPHDVRASAAGVPVGQLGLCFRGNSSAEPGEQLREDMSCNAADNGPDKMNLPRDRLCLYR